MRILITGAAGFIGSHLLRHFANNGHEVIAADRFTYAGKMRRLRGFQYGMLVGDLAQGDLPYRCMEAKPDVVIHCAAETHVDRSIMDPTTFLVSNAIGTSRLLDAFAKHGQPFPRFIVYSTDEVYGPTPKGTLYTESQPFNPSNAYSASKVAVEAVCNSFRVTHDMPITIVRPCNVYGRGQHPEKAIPKWTRQLLAGEKATLYNDGQGFRDWMHADDHCRAIEAILDKHADFAPDRRIINLARGDFHTDREVLESIMIHTFNPSWRTDEPGHFESWCADHIEFVRGRPGHDRGYAMNGRRLRELGWQPKVDFYAGLADAVKWAQDQADFWEHDVTYGT